MKGRGEEQEEDSHWLTAGEGEESGKRGRALVL